MKRLYQFSVLIILSLILLGCGGGGSNNNESPDPQYKGTIEPRIDITAIHNDLAYAINVYLPENYGEDPNKHYSVLYLLDAEFWFFPTVDLVDGKGKSIIVVGIANNGLNQRSIDYRMPGAPDYYNFLVTQVIPYIDSNYTTDIKQRTLSGHSLGGLFTGLTFLTEQTNNRYFNKYLSQDGSFWYQPNVTNDFEQQLFELGNDLPVQIVLSGATRANAKYVKRLYNQLLSRNYQQLDISYLEFPVNHLSEFPLSMDQALELFYPDSE